MHARIFINVGAPMIKSHRTVAITKKSIRISIEPKLTGIPDIDPAQLPKVPSATIVRLSVGDSSDLKLLANLSDITFGIAQSLRNRIMLHSTLPIQLLGDGLGVKDPGHLRLCRNLACYDNMSS